MMQKQFKINFSVILVILLVTYGAYYLLLYDNILHTSISSIIQSSNQLDLRSHLLVLGLLPIYIAMMIFGAVILGILVGTQLQKVLSRVVKK